VRGSASAALLLDLGLSLQPPTTAVPTAAEVARWLRGQPEDTKGTTGASQKHTPCFLFFSLNMICLCLERWGQGLVEVVNEGSAKGYATGCEARS